MVSAEDRLDKVDFDLYAILDIADDGCSDEQVIKAYRKKALVYHPDKNPGDIHAAENFLRISTALELLTNAATRAKYDRARKAKRAARERHAHLDAKRRKFKEELESREQRPEETAGKEDPAAAQQRLLAEIERLRRAGSELLKREQQNIEDQLRQEAEEARSRLLQPPVEQQSQAAAKNHQNRQIKVKWKSDRSDESNGGYSRQLLETIFQRYGVIEALVISKKKGMAIVEFNSELAATRACAAGRAGECAGFSPNPLHTITLLVQPSQTVGQMQAASTPTAQPQQQEHTKGQTTTLVNGDGVGAGAGDLDELERLVLERLRREQHRKHTDYSHTVELHNGQLKDNAQTGEL